MFHRFLWHNILRRAARRHGFLDPVALMTKLSSFAQPSEVAAPTELIRATAVLHARGLINSQAIQHNLDWVWPYWVHQQFDPNDLSFVPRAFSLTHINLTHRNWTAIGIPSSSELPIVDPRGLLTPFWDGWSLDAWIIEDDGDELIPSKIDHCHQQQINHPTLSVVTQFEKSDLNLTSQAQAVLNNDQPVCMNTWKAVSKNGGWLYLSVRPYNPEGVSFIQNIQWDKKGNKWIIDQKHSVFLDAEPDYHIMSEYHTGDVYHQRDLFQNLSKINCSIGMATAAALYRLEPGKELNINAYIPLKTVTKSFSLPQNGHDPSVKRFNLTAQEISFSIPDHKMVDLFDAAVSTLRLHSIDEIFAGPFIYKRFWFRDAAFIINALAVLGIKEPIKRAIKGFPKKQTAFGYYLSQEGEWDSNGEVIWAIRRYQDIFNEKLDDRIIKSVSDGAKWIIRKRLRDDIDALHAGLMPSGFSAEHFGPNNYYFWDNFWSYEGLVSAAKIMSRSGHPKEERQFRNQAEVFNKAIEKSIESTQHKLNIKSLPSSPYRRMDSSAIGSIISGYPLQMYSSKSPKLRATVDYLYDHHMVKGCFFHDMSHSGLNPYLTLHMAQIFLRSGDNRYLELLESLSDLASPTGHWPEAVHPNTRGGCMGDGQHVWAAAEWIMMIRNMFVREEEKDEKLILCSGVPEKWLEDGNEICFGPTHTAFGSIKINLVKNNDVITVSWNGDWHDKKPTIDVIFPFSTPPQLDVQEDRVIIKKERNE